MTRRYNLFQELAFVNTVIIKLQYLGQNQPY